MASTFTDLGLELMATGENAGTWGTKTNANLSLVEQLTGGYLSLAVAGSGTTALSIADGALTGTAQHRVIELTGALTGSRILTFPLLTENFYFIKNSTTNAETLQLKAVSGSGATVTWATTDKGWKIIYVDGVATNTGVYEIPMTSVDDVTLTGTQTLTNKTINASQLVDGSIATAKLADDLVTLAKMAPGTDGNIISYDASGNPVAVATGDAGQVLTSAGAGAPPTFEDVAGGISWVTTPKTSNFTVTAGEGYFINSGGALTVTLPAGQAGATFAVVDYARNFSTYNLTIAPNGSEKIGGIAEDATLNVDGQAATFVYVDGTKGWVNVQNAEDTETGLPPYIEATGGTISTSGDFKIHTFTGPGTFTVTSAGSPAGSTTVDHLVIAGGGGAGGCQSDNVSAGGGAGGYRESFPNPSTGGLSVSAQAYPITIGGGGAGGVSQAPSVSANLGTNGVNSTFSSITSAGGGGGGGGGPASPGTPVIGLAGGSGGGGGGGNNIPDNKGAGNTPPVSPPQGNPGGPGGSVPPGSGDQRAGGGGGAGGAGAAPSGTNSGNGGAGTASSITGSSVTRGGGGVGGANGGHPTRATATGGGGQSPGFNATANTGGGGGAKDAPTGGVTSGNGGSGIVIIRYRFQA
jgi:hypothetical protein